MHDKMHYNVYSMRKFLFILTAGVVALSGQAQTWTLQQCLDYAAEHNIKVQQNRISEKEGEEALAKNKATLFPSLSFSTTQSLNYRPFQEGTVTVENGVATATDNKVTASGNYGLNANWTIWNGGINYKNVQAQKVQNEIYALTTAQSLNTIQEQIATFYVQILYTLEGKKVNELLLETAEQQLQRGKERYEIGDLSKADLAQLESQLASAKYNVVSTETQLAGLKRQLKALLELSIETPFDIAASEMEDERALSPIPAKEEVYQLALSHRPEIKSAQLKQDAADLDLNIAKRGYYPTISMSAGIGDSHYSAADDCVGTQFKKNLSGSVGLTLSVPICDQRKNKTNVAQAKLKQTSAALNLQDQQTTLGSTIESLWLNATSEQQKFIAACSAAKSQETNYELINEQFKNGLKNIVDLLQARDQLLTAEQSKLESKYTTILDTQLLYFYQGGQITLDK